jgi:hypothetical protein
MNCMRCGAGNHDGVVACAACGQPFGGARPPQMGDDAAMRMILPVGRSGLAIAAGYLGLLSCIGPLAPFALVIGIMAMKDIKAHPEKHGMGRAWFGVIMGGLGTLLMLLWVIAKIVG